MHQPKISVVIAIYNEEDYLNKCISSVCSQSYKELQIVLVDDGSTDNSGNICDEWAKKDARILVIHQGNKGLVGCRKSGLKAATGEYILLIDGDDYMETDMIEQMSKRLSESNADIVNCGFFLGEESVHVPCLQISVTNDNREECLGKYIFDLQSEERIYSSIWTKLFRAEIIRTAYFNIPEDCSGGEDLLCLIFCFQQDITFCSVDVQLHHYVIRNSSLMNQRKKDYCRKRLPYIYQIASIMSVYDDEELQDKIDKYLKNELMTALRRSIKDPFAIQQYQIASPDIYDGKDIVLYGAGDVGKDFYSQLMRAERCNVKAWVDIAAETLGGTLPVVGLDAFLDMSCDVVILAANEQRIAENMKKTLLNIGVPEYKIVWAERLMVE